MADFTSAIGKGVGLSNMLGSQEQFVKKATEQLELSKAESKDKVEIQESKLGEISQLQKILSNIKAKAFMLTNPLEVGFDRKTASTSTQDAGSGDDYITNIHVDDAARAGDTKIAVAQVATAAELVLASAANTGFDKTAALGKDGNMVLTVGGNARTVAIVATDTVTQVVEKINHQFTTNSDDFEAFLVQGDGNTAFIEVRAKNTGAGNITVAYNGGNIENPFDQQPHTQSDVDGQDAHIYIYGVSRTQASNKFVNVVAGLSFELTGRVNAANAGGGNVAYGGLNYNTIKVKEDHSNVKKMIIEFGNSLNDLSYIIAKNQQSTRSVEQDRFADPSKPLASYDHADSPLRNSSLLTEATEIWERFTTTKAAGADDISSIYELGMGLKKETKDGVSFDSLYFEDESIFVKKFEDDFNSVRRFFVTDVKITPTAGNVSTIQYLARDSSKQITDSSVVGKDIATTTTFDAGGAVTGFTARVNGVDLVATITPNPSIGRYTASFSEDSPLRGMTFSIDPKTAVGIQETNTINYTSGIANLVKADATEMFSDDGRTGTTILEAGLIQDWVKSLSDESAKIEKDLKDLTAKLEREYQTIAQMDIMAAIQTAMIEAALSGLTAAAA
jgi:hypothetical protein